MKTPSQPMQVSPPEASAAVPAAAISYDRAGSGPPLVLLHPLGLDRRVWDPVLDRLAAERDVVALDMPGFGASPALTGPAGPTPVALAGAINRFAEGLGLGSTPHVAGNSLGAWVGLEMAAAGRVASVTALAPAGLWSRALAPKPSTGHRAVKRLRRTLPGLMSSARIRRAVLGLAVAKPESLTKEGALSILSAYASGPDFVRVNNAMRAGTFTDWDRIEVPVTLAWGDHDRVNTPPRRPEGSGGHPMLVLAGCGHLPMWDDPELVADLILKTSAERR